MTNVRSWKFWVIIALALTTLACAGRRERREQAREDRRERAEQRRAERNQPRQTERASKDADSAAQPAAQPTAQSSTQAATFQPISTAPTAATGESKVVFMRAST